MANPLQPKCMKILNHEYGAYVINLIGSSISGHGDIVACIKGLFYVFEIKYKNDQPSELQKKKINDCIDAGGKAYFIRSEEQLRHILDTNEAPVKYALKQSIDL